MTYFPPINIPGSWAAALGTTPLERRCMAFAGIVDPCRCISLTFRDRERLVQWLKNNPATKHCSHQRPFRATVNEQGEARLFHECPITDYAGVKAQIRITLSLGECNRLIAGTRYRLDLSVGTTPLSHEPIYIAPIRTL
jgi:hypothetical protein